MSMCSFAFQYKYKPEKLRVSTSMRVCELRVPTQTRSCELRVSTSERGSGLARTSVSAVTDSHKLGQLRPIFSPHNGGITSNYGEI